MQRCPKRLSSLGERGVGREAASTANLISDVVFGLPGSFPILNCCFLIFAASSIPQIGIAAVSKRLKPSISRILNLIFRDHSRLPHRPQPHRVPMKLKMSPLPFGETTDVDHALCLDSHAL